MGRDEEAAARIEEYEDVDEGEDDPDPWLRRGLALLHVRRDDEGIDACRRALEMGPGSVRLLLDVGRELTAARNDPTVPRRILDQVKTLPRNRSERLIELVVEARVLLAEERFDDALGMLNRARRQMRFMSLPGIERAIEVDVSTSLCLAHAALGHDEAVQHYKDARVWLEDAGRLDELVRCERALTNRGFPYR